MALKLYNTLTRKKELFKPIKDKEVGMYCCGPTVYWYPHIGNLRTYVFEDILKRVLLYNGFKVKHVINITDVGHLTSDADEGEDKLIKALRRENLPLTKESMIKISNMYFDAFKQDLKNLNILSPDFWPKATEHVKEMIDLIKRIEKNGFTYKTGVGLIYDTSKFKDYAKLGRLNLEQLDQGARVEKDEERKNPSDFALWISNQPNHIMLWDSPWGKGFPGWHIECSAMSMKYLGEQFDIHCGGKEHIQIHHTNEIAQSEAATGKKWVNFWLHAEWLVVPEGKMSKSKGDFTRIVDLIEKGYDPLCYRLFCFSAHYRSPLTFTFEALDSAKSAFETLKERVLDIKNDQSSHKTNNKYKEEFAEYINDDLNMPKSISVVWAVIKDKELGNKEKYELLLDFDKVLGFNIKDWKAEKIKTDKEIEKLIKERDQARKDKNFKKADEIRDRLKEKGFIIEDSAKGIKIKNA